MNLTNLLIVSTSILFTACSTKEAPIKKPEKKAQSVEHIIAVQQPSIESLPLAQTYPMPVPEKIEEVVSPAIVSTVVYNAPVVYSEPVVEYTPPRRYRTVYSPPRVNPFVIVKKIEWNAKKLLGKKYVWGATGPYSYDCSGFTQKIFRDAGIRIPRVSRDQAKVGKFVDFKHLRKGDMVFFDTHKKPTGKVTHVGIYLGKGNFIHASSGAKKIVIFNFNRRKYYKKRFLWGRRVINTHTRIASI